MSTATTSLCAECAAMAASPGPDIPSSWASLDRVKGFSAVPWAAEAPAAACPACGAVWFAMSNPRDGFDEILGPLDETAQWPLRSDGGLKHIAPLLQRDSRDVEFLLGEWFRRQDYDEAEATKHLLEALAGIQLGSHQARLLLGYLATVVGRDRCPNPALTLSVKSLFRLFHDTSRSQDSSETRHRSRQFAGQIANRIVHARVPFTVPEHELRELQTRFGPDALRNTPLDLIECGLQAGGEDAIGCLHEAWHTLHQQASSTVEGLNAYELRAAALGYECLQRLSDLPPEANQALEGTQALYRHLIQDVVAWGKLSDKDKEIGRLALAGEKLPVSSVTRPRSKPPTPSGPTVAVPTVAAHDDSVRKADAERLSLGRWLVLATGCLLIIAIAGKLFAFSIDDGSPSDGFVAGSVIGFSVWLLFRALRCASWLAAFTLGSLVALGVIVNAHYSLFTYAQRDVHARALRGDEGYDPEWTALTPPEAYRAYLSRELDATGPDFLDHLRLMAHRGTTAWEKAFMYQPTREVRRLGSQVWWGWLGQIAWLLVTVNAGAILGILWEQERREKLKVGL